MGLLKHRTPWRIHSTSSLWAFARIRHVTLPARRPDDAANARGPTHPTTRFVETVGGPRMRKSEPSTGSRLLRAGFATAATAALVVAGTATPVLAASVPVTLSSTAGPTTGGNTITASSTTAQAFLSPSTTVNVTF